MAGTVGEIKLHHGAAQPTAAATDQASNISQMTRVLDKLILYL